MRYLDQFSIPHLGLLEGEHNFTYRIDNDFFKSLNDNELAGNFIVKLDLDKRANMMVLDFHVDGSFRTPCDRCLNEIEIEIVNEFQQIVKYTEPDAESDIVYLPAGESHLDVSPFIYEQIKLSMPIKRVRDCENEDYKYCNEKALDALNQFDNTEEENPIWASLKDLNIKK